MGFIQRYYQFMFDTVYGLVITYGLLFVSGFVLALWLGYTQVIPFPNTGLEYIHLSVHNPTDVQCNPTGFGTVCRVYIHKDYNNVELGLLKPTGSMLPLIAGNSTTINVKVSSLDDIQPGDLVCYEDDDASKYFNNSIDTCHRVISIDYKSRTFVTRGDNWFLTDAIPESRLKSKIIAVVN